MDNETILTKESPGFARNPEAYCAEWPAIAPAVEKLLPKGDEPLPPHLEAIREKFYDEGLYAAYPAKAKPEDYLEKVVLWSAALCAHTSRMRVYDCARLLALRITELDIVLGSMSQQSGFVVVLNAPKWQGYKTDAQAQVARAVNYVMWGRPIAKKRATIIVGDTRTYPFYASSEQFIEEAKVLRHLTNNPGKHGAET